MFYKASIVERIKHVYQHIAYGVPCTNVHCVLNYFCVSLLLLLRLICQHKHSCESFDIARIHESNTKPISWALRTGTSATHHRIASRISDSRIRIIVQARTKRTYCICNYFGIICVFSSSKTYPLHTTIPAHVRSYLQSLQLQPSDSYAHTKRIE